MEFSGVGAELLGITEAAALRVLARAHEPMSGREVARRAATSPSSTRRVLERLHQVGLVHARAYSHAVLYTANRQHVLWDGVQALLTGPARLEAELSELVDIRSGQRATLAVFGSVARGEATAASDIDLVLVFPDDVADGDRDALFDELTDLTEIRSGNPAQILALTRRQLQNMIIHSDPLIDSLTRDARTLTGTPLATLISTPQQKLEIGRAAAISGRSVTDFSVSALVKEAADVIAHERDLSMPEQAWQAFNAIIERPARSIDGFAELLKRPTVFDE